MYTKGGGVSVRPVIGGWVGAPCLKAEATGSDVRVTKQ
jgi:hypothetical protein